MYPGGTKRRGEDGAQNFHDEANKEPGDAAGGPRPRAAARRARGHAPKRLLVHLPAHNPAHTPPPHPAPAIAPKTDVGERKYGRSPASRPTAIAVATSDVSPRARDSHHSVSTRTHVIPTKAPTTPPATAHGADTELLKQ